MRANINACFFLDPTDASVKEIQIPFHYALSTMNSATSKDIHLLRRLKNHLRCTESTKLNIEEITSTALDFQTVEVRQQCLEMLLKSKQLQAHVFQSIINAFDFTLRQQIDEPLKFNVKNLDELKPFHVVVRNYNRLCMFYMDMKVPQKKEHVDQLEISESDFVIIEQLVLLLSNSFAVKQLSVEAVESELATKAVSFGTELDDVGDFVDFLNLFQVDQVGRIPLSPDKSQYFGEVSGRLFNRFFKHGLCFDQFKSAAEKSLIPCQDLLVLALYYWLEKPFVYKNW